MSAGLFLSALSRDIGVGIGPLSLYFSVASAVMIIWLPIAGRLIEKYPLKWLLVIAGLLQGLSFASIGLVGGVIGIYLLAVPQTLGAGILVNLLGPIVIQKYFPKRRARLLGIQMGVVWIFASVLLPLISIAIKNIGWRISAAALGILSSAVSVFCAFFLLNGEDAEEKRHPVSQNTPLGSEEEESARKHSFIFFLLLAFFISISGIAGFTQHVPKYAQSLGYKITDAGFFASIGAIGSSLGAFTIGLISEKIGERRGSYAVIGIWLLAVVGFLFSGHGKVIFALSSFLFGISSASVGILMPSLCSRFFDKADYARLFSRISIGAPLASLVLLPLYGYIYDFAESYLAVLWLLIALLAIAAVFISLTRKGKKAKNEQE